jgi:YidC/Oxa1 family membrane protein insertase
MKMNRTEWTVVILCAAAMGYFLTRPSPPAPKKEDKPATAEAAAQAQPGGAPPAANPGAPAVPPPPVVEEKEIIITSGDGEGNKAAEYTFTNIGGGLKQVKILSGQFAGKTEQLLNYTYDHGKLRPIGALSTAPGSVESLAYTVEAQTEKAITFSATNNGLKITKKWELAAVPEDSKFTEGYGYLWNFSVTITNTADAAQAGQYYLYSGLIGQLHSNDWIFPSATWYADGDAVEKAQQAFDNGGFLGFGKRAPTQTIEEQIEELTYAGIHNQYYTVLFRPEEVKVDGITKTWMQRQYITQDDGGKKFSSHGFETGVGLDSFNLSKDQSYTWKGQVYTGPRSGTVLNKLGGDLNQSMHYGWFRVLSRAFLGLLNWFYSWTGIYAVAIMLLTLFVRVCIWPLHIKATRAMKRMSKLAPMMKDIREKHKDEPQKMNMEVMKLYREYGVNPLGGCLPLLFQFPIFLGYFNMMRPAVEFRGHSFLWVQDLSMPDTVATVLGIPINPLPILMTITMWIQMKVSPQPTMADNPQMQMQMKIFKVMPFIFMFFCYSFASALALYWTVQNIISIGQTWLMARQPEPELKKLPPRPSFMERAMAAQQAKMAQQQKKGPPRTGGGGGSAFRDQQKKK